MKGLRFTEETRKVALVFFTFFFVYGLINTPVIQFIVCLAVAAIVQGVSDSYEIALIAFLMMNYIYPMFSRRSVAGYSNKVYASANVNPNANANANASEGFVDVSAITSRIKNMVTGVGSPMTEGFADASDNDLTLNKSEESENSSDVTATTKPSSASTDADATVDKNAQLAKMTQMMSSVLKNMGDKAASPSSNEVRQAEAGADAHAPPTATKISEQNVPAVTQPAESFTDNGGLFKLGQIPTEAKGGFHIDAGTTVMNAINALKPDQIKAMTQDTKQLIDTQKSLMGMLQTFQPMVQEGKQMMDTFQTMFSPSMGAK
jgi:hypothetical protein